ncbi:MAG: hypothetical protein LKE46_09990 [Clostridium sp.]|uniref:hypothetical protein n=1 Tax=Clostridium TaxID=1485 RepID=UPI0007BF1ACC|nr:MULTISPECIES: hypothetical protein [Clostridium]MCH3964594.1 hypothetical protein [Clostridium sp.]MCH4198554.1 hypothetical protein [Clostridium tyrobutyricum]MCH4237734.1 hypothetical protein [Clostridium tyrobutyricum]MCI1239741.1 hypothetical protein [Clostridium tyrobutyricum]MCI1715065.1 hypothetical protein [Clostridium sp.]
MRANVKEEKINEKSPIHHWIGKGRYSVLTASDAKIADELGVTAVQYIATENYKTLLKEEL